jgi:hypothetical protein
LRLATLPRYYQSVERLALSGFSLINLKNYIHHSRRTHGVA